MAMFHYFFGNVPQFDVDVYPPGSLTQLLKMAIEIVSFPIENHGSFHSYVALPEGISHQIPLDPIKPP